MGHRSGALFWIDLTMFLLRLSGSFVEKVGCNIVCFVFMTIYISLEHVLLTSTKVINDIEMLNDVVLYKV